MEERINNIIQEIKLIYEKNKKQITSSKDMFLYIFDKNLLDLNYEEFWVVYLDRANQVINTKKISQGGISGTVVDIRLIIKEALLINAVNIILFHNHPSGSLNPSKADLDLTKKISEAGKLFDIIVLDHLIIANGTYLSMADEGLIK